MPLVQTRGAASAQGFGEFAQVSAVNYIEDVFSCFLYTGNASTQTITNNIDLAGKGGLVWTKNRTNAYDNYLYDTARGVNKVLLSNNTIDQQSLANTLTAFNSNGFTLGNQDYGNITNGASAVSWTFRKQPKFFDVVTYTGNSSTQTINHNLGSTPGMVIIKLINQASTVGWVTYHRSVTNPNDNYLLLNSSNQPSSAPSWISPTSTNFTVGNYSDVNNNNNTYVAYLFAHDAGGFGLSGTDNVISCGSYTEGASAQNINLGYEPQWLLMKKSNGAGAWYLFDTMRGMDYTDLKYLEANTSGAESSFGGAYIKPTATGFTAASGFFGSGSTIIYIAIRRGPMKVPTLGTSVFSPVARTGNAALTTVTSGFATDVVFARRRDTLDNANESVFADKLRGSGTLSTNNTAAEYNGGATSGLNAYLNTGVRLGINNSPIYAFNYNTLPYVLYQFQRAPSFFDEVCFTSDSGGGTGANLPHNLTVEPNLMIFKDRGSSSSWLVTCTEFASWQYYRMYLDSTAGKQLDGNGVANSNASTFAVFNNGQLTASSTYVAYLFATCAGVSKVGSYTGYAGYTVTVPCGFTGGVRFVLIKRTDSTGDWWVYDSARGITSGNDPYLYLNSTAAEVGGTDYIDSYSAGFEVTSTAPAGLNATGGTYIFLAVS